MTASVVLSQIVAQALLPGEAKAPNALLAEIAAGKHSIDGLSNHDVTNQIFHAFYSEFDFLRSAGVSAPLQPQESDLWTGLLRWLIQELREWRAANDRSTAKLAAIIVVSQASDIQAQLWGALPNDIQSNTDLLGAFKLLVSSFSVQFASTDAARTPIWESEAVEEFKKADAAGDWAKIGLLWRPFEHVARPNVLQRQVVRALFRYDLNGLVEASGKLNETAVAMQVSEILKVQQRLDLATASPSPYIQFASVYQTISRSQGTQALSLAEIASMERLLGLVAADAPRWAGWMQFFNAYPVRYPLLQVPLGRCLASAPNTAIEPYLNAVILYPSPVTSPVLGGDEIANCLREFRSTAPLDRRKSLWTLAHQRWLDWGFDRANRDTHLLAVSRSQIDYALVGYACECMDQAGRERAIDDVRKRLERVDDTWHPSSTDVVTAWNRLLSEMQPYAHARNVVASGQDWLPTTQYSLPFDPAQNRYLAIKYRMS